MENAPPPASRNRARLAPGAPVRSTGYHQSIATRFASSDELSADELRDAPLRSLPRPSRLEEPLEAKGKQGAALETLGIETYGDLLEHFPREHREGDVR